MGNIKRTRDVNKERVALLQLAAQIESEDHFCPLCIQRNKGFFILCCSAFTILTIGIIFIIIRVPEVRPNLPTDILLSGWVTKGRSQMLDQLHVNLDDVPEDRWTKIGQKYTKYGIYISETVSILKQSPAYSDLLRIANGSSLQDIISHYTNSTLLQEIRGYSKYMNVSYEDLILFNLLSPYNMQNDISIVSDDQGKVWQRIYLASVVASRVPRFNAEITYYYSGKMVFKTVGGIGLVGTPTGVRLKSFSISLSLKNAPDENCDIGNSSFLSSLAVRQVLSECKSYEEALEYLKKSSFAGNFVLGGFKPGEVIVIKNRCEKYAVLTSEVIQKQNPVYTIQMTASQPTRFEAFRWKFDE